MQNEKMKVKIDDFGKMNYLSEVSYAPNGKAAAFVLSQADVEENCYKSAIWLWKDGKARRLTTGGSEAGFIWLDDERIMFPGDRKKAHKPAPGAGVTVYNVININGGEAEEYFTVPMRVGRIRKLSETEYLLVATYDHYGMNIAGLEGEEKEAAIAKIEEEKDYEVFDELPFWSNGRGVINKKRSRLYLFNKDTKELKLLSPEWMNVSGFDYDEASDKVLYYGSDYQWIDERIVDMYIRELHGENTIKMNFDGKFRSMDAHFLDGQIIFAGSMHLRYGTAENSCQYLGDPVTGQWKELCDLDSSMYSSVGSDCRHGGGRGSKIDDHGWYYTPTRGFNSYIAKLTADGKETIVSPEINGSIDCWDKNGEDFLYVAMRNGGLQELYTCKEGSSEEIKLTSFNDEYLESHAVSPLEYISFVDSDGVEIDGWIIKPVDYDENKTYPAILDVHGGPKTVYGETFFHEMQLWASEGYFVFFCNPRGGDGKGNDFADIAGPNYGVKDYNDLMEFTDLVLEKYPQIDKTKVGMTGGSYGGFMANWIVGHTDRFAAVASQRSISNFISKCLTTDIGYYHNLSAVQSDPWNSPEEMWNRSPLKYADKCVTPTLFIQSDEDYRCWMCDAIQMFTALRMHGCPTRMCLFHGENHELSRNGKPKHRIRRLKEITDWFDTYLKA